MGLSSLHSRSRGLLGCLTMAGLCAAHPARADEVSECPRLADVVTGLGQVLTTEQTENAADEMMVRDQGATWSIEVRGHAASYSDPSRNCAERARVATVFAALALEPLETEEPVVAPTPPPAPTRRLTLEAGAQLVLATLAQGRNTPLGGGGQVRIVRSGKHLGVSLGIEAAAFSKLNLGWYGASITRAACDLSGRVSWALGSLILAGEVGPYLALLRVRGTGLDATSGVNRVDIGGRVGLLVRLDSRLAPFLALQAELGARRFDLAVAPSGNIGSAPRLWLGLVVGAAFDL
jgi:hypothetical protein